MANIKPLGNNVLIKSVKEDETSKAGIILPETVDKERSEQGEVIAIGDGKVTAEGKKLEMTVKVGDKVVFKKYSPDEIKIKGEEFLVIAETDILGIIQS